jgi:hypothetical protein
MNRIHPGHATLLIYDMESFQLTTLAITPVYSCLMHSTPNLIPLTRHELFFSDTVNVLGNRHEKEDLLCAARSAQYKRSRGRGKWLINET